MARRSGSNRFRTVATDRLGAADGNFAVAVPLAAGRWQFKAAFTDPGRVVGATSRTVKATIGPKPPSRVRLLAVKVTHGALTVTGSVAPAGGTVQLLALRTTGGAARFGVVARTRAKATRVTLHARLLPGNRWALQLQDLPSGSVSTLRTVNVR
jgi:hypothetical protein